MDALEAENAVLREKLALPPKTPDNSSKPSSLSVKGNGESKAKQKGKVHAGAHRPGATARTDAAMQRYSGHVRYDLWNFDAVVGLHSNLGHIGHVSLTVGTVIRQHVTPPRRVGMDHQVCLAHLLRDIQYAIDAGDDAFAPGIKKLLKQAVAIGRRRERLAEVTLAVYANKLEMRLDQLLKIAPQHRQGQKLQRIIKRFRQNLFVFVTNREVPPTNNGSEQALRPCVIFRKVTNCFRSEWGPNSTPMSGQSSTRPDGAASLFCGPFA